MRRIINKIRFFIHAFFFGLRSADVTMLAQICNGSDDIDIHHTIEAESNVFSDLLEQKETQEVKEMRDEMYRVTREAAKYDVATEVSIGESGEFIFKEARATKKNMLDRTPQNIYLEEGEKVRVVQDCHVIVKGVVEASSELLAGAAEENEYKLKIKRDFAPKFKIEKYTTKLVVKTLDNDLVQIEFYCNQEAPRYSKLDAIFIAEANRLYKKEIYKSAITDIDNVSFIAEKAFNADDLCEFSYNNLRYQKCITYDGHFIFIFKGNIEKDGEDIAEKYRMKEVDQKYAEHAPKNSTYSINNFTSKDYIPSEMELNYYNEQKKTD